MKAHLLVGFPKRSLPQLRLVLIFILAPVSGLRSQPTSDPVECFWQADDVVPWRHQVRLLERLSGGDVTLERIEGGDHRLSSPSELSRLIAAVERLRR